MISNKSLHKRMSYLHIFCIVFVFFSLYLLGDAFYRNDHVHMCISIPPKHAVSEVIGYLKGKSAIAVARQFGGKKQNFSGENLWARGYAVSTVGFELEKVKEYIAHQEKLELDQEEGKF